MSRIPNQFGEYGITTDAADALRVEYADCGEDDPVDLTTLVRFGQSLIVEHAIADDELTEWYRGLYLVRRDLRLRERLSQPRDWVRRLRLSWRRHSQ